MGSINFTRYDCISPESLTQACMLKIEIQKLNIQVYKEKLTNSNTKPSNCLTNSNWANKSDSIIQDISIQIFETYKDVRNTSLLFDL